MTGAERAHHSEGAYDGPLLIINTALNLVAGKELAWQDRKAESFILTPTHCGAKGTGYVRTTQSSKVELTLGRAMSISGAAVDSNIGVQQSSALIALMTALNARLGWWILNPKHFDSGSGNEWDARSPAATWPILYELFGQTDAEKEYVHLSDGGHFENLGVYELVRRRCRYIVCVDAGTDPGASDDNLANLIRLCRTDFGVRIEMDTSPFALDPTTGLGRGHCAVGKIRYDDVDGGELPGMLVLIRAVMTGDEPSDVQEYAAKNPTFPRQSTADQFFDEAQFESYRALGFHAIQATFKDALDDVVASEGLWSCRDSENEFRWGNRHLFSAVQRRWAASPVKQDETFLKISESWRKVQTALRRDDNLAELSRDVYPERNPVNHLAGGRSELHAVAEMVLAMEDAWVGLNLGGYRNLPINRGWMSAFRRWSGTAAFRRYWPMLRPEFSQDFVRFCEAQLGLQVEQRAVLQYPEYAKAVIAELGVEFEREWPNRKPLHQLVDEAVRAWDGRCIQTRPPLWTLFEAARGPGDIEDRPGRIPCGVAFAWPCEPSRTPDDADKNKDCYRIFIWIRRPYRSMGIASRTAWPMLREFAWMIDPDKGVILETHYPCNPDRLPRDHRKAMEDDMELELWKSFFGHFDFRCPRGQEPICGDSWVVSRCIEKSDLDEIRRPQP